MLEALDCSADVLKHRKIDFIDISADKVDPKKVKLDEVPETFQSTKAGRGPLLKGWQVIYDLWVAF